MHDSNADTSRTDPDDVVKNKSKKWTREDAKALVGFWNQKLTNEEIGEKLNRGANAIGVKASRLGLPPRAELEGTTKKKLRPCMRCRAAFHSDGSHHRICDTCKSTSAWQSGMDPVYSASGY